MRRFVVAEIAGTAFLTMAVIGSGIAASRLSPGDVGLQLLESSVATGAALTALILVFGTTSAAFNPVVSAVGAALRYSTWRQAGVVVVAQVVGAVLGAVVANLMFDLPAISISDHARGGAGTGLAEVVATSGLVVVVFGLVRTCRTHAVGYAVGGYITAAYWFTASTSFAKPALTLARMLSDTFAGISPGSVPLFLSMQLLGAVLALGLIGVVWPDSPEVPQ